MREKWKLIYDENTLKIHNENGKNLSYNPNGGILILVQDGYAFKDLNRSGSLDPFEDWRLPMKVRVKDFSERYHLAQKDDVLYYEKGIFQMPESLVSAIKSAQPLKAMFDEEDSFLREHYVLVVMLMMFDHDHNQYLSDYIIQLFIESLEMGMLDKIFYTIKKAVQSYLYDELNAQAI